MKVSDILDKINEERKIESRYPLRIIFCDNLEAYKYLVAQLNNTCDLIINIGEFCAADDVHPRFRKIEKLIEKESDKQILLTSVGEYLRYAIKRECDSTENAQFDSFWRKQYSVDSKTRVYIPLFACKDIFQRIVGTIDQRQEIFLWNLDAEDEQQVYQVSVYSTQFRDSLNTKVIFGFKNWLLKWDQKIQEGNYSFVTAQYKDCEESYGLYSISIVENPYGYLCKNYEVISVIPEDMLDQSFWIALYSDLQDIESIEEVILNAINLQQFDSGIIATQWENLSPISQKYVWLWFQLHTPTDYVGNIIHRMRPSELKYLPEHIANDILPYVENKPDWVKERKGIMAGMRSATPSQQFFDKLDTYVPKKVLELLTGASTEEKSYIVKTVCRWLRTGGDISDSYNEIIDSVRGIYPEFSWYMMTRNELYKNYTDYFTWYKKKKISNRYVDSPISHPDYELLDSRYAVISKYTANDALTFWVDGMGIEWLSLAVEILERLKGNSFDLNVTIAAARVPTETEYNQQWTPSDIKRNRLDKLSHKGMPDDKDYFSCITNQIRVIKELMNEAVSLLDDHEYVIITGDHGSSRLAALAFHQKAHTFLPNKATAMAHGRFCKLSEEPKAEDLLDNVEYVTFENQHYLVMKDYNHYKQSGNVAGGNSDEYAVAGELHGGLSPEESIVPVIVLHNRESFKYLEIQEIPSRVKVKGGEGSISVLFNKPVDSLAVDASGGECVCKKGKSPEEWILDFKNLSGQEVRLSFIANGKLIKTDVSLKIKTPLGTGGGLLP